MDLRTAYRVLDTPIGAGATVVKSHYRRKIAQFHPDRNKSADAHARTIEVNRAFRVIEEAGFPSESQVHAREGRGAGAGSSRRGTESGFQGFWSGSGFGAGAGFDEEPSSGRGADWESRRSAYGARPPKRGRTVNRKVKLTLEEAIAGKTVVLTGHVAQTCEVCEGSGRSYARCATCGGSGRVAASGARHGERACVQCAGSGFRTARCETCHGTGKAGQRPYSARVRIPAGVEPGATLQAKGSAHRRDGDPSGFKIAVEISKHDVFHFEPGDETHLGVVVPIHALEFLLRETQAVPTPWGERAVKPTASPWLEIPEAGFPDRKSGKRGPLRVHWDLHTDVEGDTRLTERMRELLQQLKGKSPQRKEWEETVARWKARTGSG